MRFSGVFCSLILWAAVTVVHADVKIGFEFSHEKFVQYEPVMATIIVENDSGSPFIIDDYGKYSANSLVFEVSRDIDSRDKIPAKKGKIVKHVMLMPGERQSFLVDISDWFDVSQPDRYFVTPVVLWGDREYVGKRLRLNIVSGFEIKRITRSVDGYGNNLHLDYRLLYLTRDGTEHLFLRVDEVESNLTYGAMQIGRVLRVFKPDMTVDRNGRVEIVHQASPYAYYKTTLTSGSNGVEIEDQVPVGLEEPKPRSSALTSALENMDTGADASGDDKREEGKD